MKIRFRMTAFLAEALINILFFSAVCAILALVFVRSYAIGQTTNDKNKAAVELASLSQEIKAGEGVPLFEYEKIDENRWRLYFDADWVRCGSEQAVFYLDVERNEQVRPRGILQDIEGKAYKKATNELLYEMNTTHYFPQEGGVLR